MATANHFWLDVAAGVALALVSVSLVVWVESLRRRDDSLDPAAVP
jgi:membrane-associated phospholipid phosphatase